MTVWNPDGYDCMKFWHPYDSMKHCQPRQHEALTATTVWNVERRDSMEHWQHDNIKTLAAMTVWNIRSQVSMKPWQVWGMETRDSI